MARERARLQACAPVPARPGRFLAHAGDAFLRLERSSPLDSLARSDREETLARWLDEHGIAGGWKLASNFVTACLDPEWLGALANKLNPASHSAALNWLDARLNPRSLLKLVDQSTGRVADLVKAITSYTHMDQSPTQDVDVHEGLESTLTMLGHKLKGVTLIRAFDRSVPRIMAYGSELNQVWTNLIDKAVHAVKGTGRICVGTFHHQRSRLRLGLGPDDQQPHHRRSPRRRDRVRIQTRRDAV